MERGLEPETLLEGGEMVYLSPVGYRRTGKALPVSSSGFVGNQRGVRFSHTFLVGRVSCLHILYVTMTMLSESRWESQPLAPLLKSREPRCSSECFLGVPGLA